MNTETQTLPFYMVDIDFVRDYDGATISTTVYSDEEFDNAVADLRREGYEVVSTEKW
jgi:hypothetical protein